MPFLSAILCDFRKVGDEVTLNRILWFAAKGEEEFLAAYAGAHGRGLEALKLKLAVRKIAVSFCFRRSWSHPPCSWPRE